MFEMHKDLEHFLIVLPPRAVLFCIRCFHMVAGRIFIVTVLKIYKSDPNAVSDLPCLLNPITRIKSLQ
jgi:hypothetical protein